MNGPHWSIRNLKQNKKHIKKTPKKLPDFSLNDILNAPKPKAPSKHADGRSSALGCTICGSMRYISKGEIKVFRGERMKVCHCYECGQDFYKSE